MHVTLLTRSVHEFFGCWEEKVTGTGTAYWRIVHAGRICDCAQVAQRWQRQWQSEIYRTAGKARRGFAFDGMLLLDTRPAFKWRFTLDTAFMLSKKGYCLTRGSSHIRSFAKEVYMFQVEVCTGTVSCKIRLHIAQCYRVKIKNRDR